MRRVLALGQALGLDAVWWLVSPGNPLKPKAGMAPLAARLASARKMARNSRILAAAPEAVWGTRYTIDTLEKLQHRFPQHDFIWLMGADNLGQISNWAKWLRIFQHTPVAVFARAPYNFKVLAGVAARRFGRFRWNPHKGAAKGLGFAKPPAWVFFHIRANPASASAIRAQQRARII